MTDGSDLRVSDADRERAASALREHFSAGRIDGAELEARLEAAYAARTGDQLRELFTDLPPSAGEDAAAARVVSAEQAALAVRRHRLRRALEQQAGGGVGLFAFCTLIWLMTGAEGMFWPIWVLAATGVVVARAAWNLWGPAPDLDRVEAELDRSRRRAQRRGERRHRDRRR